MSYSNDAYAILSFVVDKAAGQSLESFLDERIFKPLGMTRTVLDLDGSEANKLGIDGNITELFEKDEEASEKIDYETFKERPNYYKMKESITILISDLL